MARIRSIKPDFFRHRRLYLAEKEAGLPLRIAFAGLWCCADREGRFKWEPEELKLDCLPYDEVEFSRVLDALATRQFIAKYEVDGRFYGFIPGFRKHQVVNNRESASNIPEPPQKIKTLPTREGRDDDASATRHDPAQAEGEVEGNGREGSTTLAPRASLRDAGVNGHDLLEDPIIERIPMCGKHGEFEVRKSLRDELDRLYPAVDPDQTLREIRGWNLAHPDRRKTPRGIRRHIFDWFKGEQDKQSRRVA